MKLHPEPHRRLRTAPGNRLCLRAKLLRHARAGLLPVLLVTLLGTGCTVGPHVLPVDQQKTIDRQITEYPAGFELKPFIVDLDSPTGFCIDENGNWIIAEGGINGFEPHIFGIKPNGTKFEIYPVGQRIPFFSPGFRIRGPIGGIACYHGRIFVSHRDADHLGVITSFGYDGSHKTVVANLPAQGDYSVTDIAVSPFRGRLYFGVGATTNSGVVGLDNWEEGWARDYPACDEPYWDIKLLGYRFDAKNPQASIFTPDSVVTVPFRPFGVSNITEVRGAPLGRPTGAIYSVSPEGGDLNVDAWGVRNPVGLAVNSYGSVYFTDQGMELRGTRPIYQDPDALFRLVPDAWYGWPDYSRSLQPITLPQFQPPDWMVISTGYPDVGFVIDHDASKLSAPDQRWIAGLFKPLSGVAKMAFVPPTGPFHDYRGDLIVALWGDRAPFATNHQPLLKPLPGYKVVRVDPDSRDVKDFIFNTRGGPASQHHLNSGQALERPIDVKFGPDGFMYILDFGRMRMKSGKEVPATDAGVIWKLVPLSATRPSPK